MARSRCRATLPDDGARDRRLVTRTIERDLGKLTLRRLSTQRLDAYYASLHRERGLSPASVRHVHAVLRGALG